MNNDLKISDALHGVHGGVHETRKNTRKRSGLLTITT